METHNMKHLSKNYYKILGMVAHAYNSNTWEQGRRIQVPGQAELQDLKAEVRKGDMAC